MLLLALSSFRVCYASATVFAVVADVVVEGGILAEVRVWEDRASPASGGARSSPSSIGFHIIIIPLATME
jgi:hypothetical protein